MLRYYFDEIERKQSRAENCPEFQKEFSNLHPNYH
jgi:hypothetical protein